MTRDDWDDYGSLGMTRDDWNDYGLLRMTRMSRDDKVNWDD